MEMEEILYRADIVVYGEETERYNVGASEVEGLERMDSIFNVYCVFKNDDITLPIPNSIILETVAPRTDCSGTRYNIDERIILAIQRTDSGNFTWHEVNVVPDGAAFPASESNLEKAVSVCGLTEAIVPDGHDALTSPTCPDASSTEACSPPTCISDVCDGTSFLKFNLLCLVFVIILSSTVK